MMTLGLKRAARWTLPMLAVLALAACDDDDDTTDPPTPIEWQATLAGAGAHDEIEGTAVVESTTSQFVAEISIEGAEDGDEFTWMVARGTCANPGTAIGAANSYPELEVGTNGTAAAEATVNLQLEEDEDYIVRVIDGSGTNPVTAACGVLETE